MNDLIDRDHRDDDIRAVLGQARDEAPLPVSWDEVVERHDRVGSKRRMGSLAIAAAVVAVGLLGLVVALQLRGDTGEVPADTPDGTSVDGASVTTVGRVDEVERLADLGPDDWVVPTDLPDGYDVVMAFDPDRRSGRSLTIGGEDVFDVYLVVSELGAGSDEIPAGESIVAGGVTWSLQTFLDEETGVSVTDLQRRAGDRVVRLSSSGAAEVLVAIAEGLESVADDEFDLPALSSDGEFTEVAEQDGATVSVIGVEGYYCVQVGSTDGGGIGCGATAKSFAPVSSGATYSDGEASFTGGVAGGDVARIEFLRPRGVSVVVEPTDLSGRFDDRFWVAEGPLTGDQAIVTFDDGTTQLVESILPGGQWMIVDGGDVVGTSPAPAAADQLAGLSQGDWVEPAELPEGYDTAIAIERAPEGVGLIVSGPEVNDVDVNVWFGDGDPVDGPTVELGGATWTTNDLVDEETGEVVGRRAERRAGEAVVTITATGDADSLFEVAAALRPVDPADATIPMLSADGPFTRVVTSGDRSVEVRGESGYYCVTLVTQVATSNTCGTSSSELAPLAEAIGATESGGRLAVGVAEGDVARIEFLRVGSEPIVVEPTDESGQFGERFWIAEGLDNFVDTGAAPRAIITYDDGTTVAVERSPFSAHWLFVDEP